jgi:hypothetical protein
MKQGVTICITTRDRPTLTIAAVHSAEAAPGVDQIVLVDSGSSEANLASLRRGLSSTQFIAGAFKNAAAARNAALSKVETDLVGFLDSDDLMRPEKTTCLEPILRQDDTTVLAVGRTEVVDGSGLSFPMMQSVHDAGYEVNDSLGTSYAAQCVHFTAFSSATLMRTSAVREIGGYDETLPAMEDVDVYLRLARVGTVRTARCATAVYRSWSGNVGAAQSAAGTVAVARKHLDNLPPLSPDDRNLAIFGLSMRAAVSEQTLRHGQDARAMLRSAARADIRRSLSSTTWWRILGSSLLPNAAATLRRRLHVGTDGVSDAT